jgi:hypothetical protein
MCPLQAEGPSVYKCMIGMWMTQAAPGSHPPSYQDTNGLRSLRLGIASVRQHMDM